MAPPKILENVSIRTKIAIGLTTALANKLGQEFDGFEELGRKIESQLYNFYNRETSAKYKNKYRALIFNIKDKKNSWLARDIQLGHVTPKELVRMTSEQMANDELKKFRVSEKEKNLEKIRSNELDLHKNGIKFVYKTHKGEKVREIAPPVSDVK